jgi:AbrB family looped-hinge helix DNA binding protein
VKLTKKGQVTIPQLYRNQFGLHPYTEVTFEPADGGVLIKPATAARRRQAQAALRRARGKANAKLSTIEIMKLTRGET